MRIIAGKFRSRKLLFPPADITRPTTDRVREAVFSIIQSLDANIIEGAPVLDVFAGSGAYGLEALSRGAGHVYFMENNSFALDVLRQNINNLEAGSICSILQDNALQPRPAPSCPMKLIFLDPPYNKNLEIPCLTALQKQGWIDKQSLIILETSKAVVFPEYMDILIQRQYGAAFISILKLAL